MDDCDQFGEAAGVAHLENWVVESSDAAHTVTLRRFVKSGPPRDERGGNVLAPVVLDEMSAGSEFLMRLSDRSRDTGSEVGCQVAEHRVLGAPQGEERLGPLL
jgi:hypothetical protein